MALHGPTTILHLRVVDQSDLYGRLRKIHDLNLQLVSVQEVEGERSRKAGEKLQWLETDPPTTSGT